MGFLRTGMPNSIPYPDPFPSEPDYFYTTTIASMANVINSRIQVPAYHFNHASSGTISTTTVRLLPDLTITAKSSGALSEGYAYYVKVDFLAVIASIEATVADCQGYFYAESWNGGSLFATSNIVPFAHPAQSYQTISPVMLAPETDTEYEVRFFASSRSTGVRFKFFESRFPTPAQLPTTIKFEHFFAPV